MESNEPIIPVFDDIQEAINTGSPFKISRYTSIKLNEISEDKWCLIHDALLLDTDIRWQIRNEQELHFISNVIRTHNNIKGIEIEFHKEFNDANMDELATSIESSQIRHVSINKREHDSLNLSRILQALRNAKYLIRIVVHFAPMPIEFEAFACALQNEQLKTLRLGTKELSPELWSAITPALSKASSLKKLYLWSFGSAECQALGEILQKNTSLLKLVLADSHSNEITVEDIEHLLIGLKNHTTLKTLYFVHPTDLTEEAMNLFCGSLSHNQIHISALNIMSTPLSKDNIRVLSDSLKTNTMLTSLEVTGCRFDYDLCEVFSEGLAQNTTLTTLDVRANDIDREGTIVLCKSLEHNKSLTSLLIGIHDEDCFAVADLVQNNNSIEVLTLESYKFIDEGMWDLCEVIAENKTLRELNISCRMSLKNGAYEDIKHMLTMNTTLRKFEVDRNASSDSICSLSEGLKNNIGLCHFVIGLSSGFNDNDFYLNDIVLNEMLEVLETNVSLDTIEFELDQREIPKQLVPDLTRNRRLKSEARFKVAILSHNIARSHQALATLPREIWISILSSITHPGMAPFDNLVRTIFNSNCASKK